MSKPIKSKSAKSKANKTTSSRAATSGAPKTTVTRTNTKHDMILNLLRRKQGASLEEMQKISGWQAHSLRGFLAGTVKKRLGLKLTSAKSNAGERHYFVDQA